jgi:hypothetical protein
VFKIGRQPVIVQLAAYYNVVKPTHGPDWQVRAQVQFSDLIQPGTFRVKAVISPLLSDGHERTSARASQNQGLPPSISGFFASSLVCDPR